MTRKPAPAKTTKPDADAPAPDAATEVKRWFLADGTPYKGLDFRDDKNKPFGEMDVSCGKCRGSGKRRFGRRKFGSCQECGGQKTIFTQVRIYSESEIVRKDNKRQAARATITARAREREAAAKGRWDFWCTENSSLVDRAREADDPWINGVLVSGEIYGHLTEAQAKAVHRKLVELDIERRACIGSRPVGTEKDRLELDVTCRRVGSFMGKAFGRGRGSRGSREVFITEMIDSDGNALISITENFKLAKGDKAQIRGTVKEHDRERKPWPVTVLTRIVMLSHDPAPVVEERPDYEDVDLMVPPTLPGEVAGEFVDHGAGMNLPY